MSVKQTNLHSCQKAYLSTGQHQASWFPLSAKVQKPGLHSGCLSLVLSQPEPWGSCRRQCHARKQFPVQATETQPLLLERSSEHAVPRACAKHVKNTVATAPCSFRVYSKKNVGTANSNLMMVQEIQEGQVKDNKWALSHKTCLKCCIPYTGNFLLFYQLVFGEERRKGSFWKLDVLKFQLNSLNHSRKWHFCSTLQIHGAQ